MPQGVRWHPVGRPLCLLPQHAAGDARTLAGRLDHGHSDICLVRRLLGRCSRAGGRRQCVLSMHAADTPVDRLGRRDSEGSLARRTSDHCSRTGARRRLVEVERIERIADHSQRVGIQSVVVEDRPSEAASCAVVHTRPDLDLATSHGHFEQLPDVVAPLPPCESSPLPSSSPSTLCESL